MDRRRRLDDPRSRRDPSVVQFANWLFWSDPPWDMGGAFNLAISLCALLAIVRSRRVQVTFMIAHVVVTAGSMALQSPFRIDLELAKHAVER